MGDVFVTYGFACIDLDAGGSIDGRIPVVVHPLQRIDHRTQGRIHDLDKPGDKPGG